MSDRVSASGPSLEYLMASVIRLMSVCTSDDCPARQQTLLHLLGYLLKHPELARTPGAVAAVNFARNTWLERIQRALPDGDPTRMH
jgi:hypothetical protein